jgi:predicted acyltransferase
LSGYSKIEQTVWILVAGLVLVWLGSMLDVALMPINKSLWTPPYAIMMTGWALLVFGAFYWLLDVNPHEAVRAAAARWAKPLQIYGMNALFIFAFSGLVVKTLAFIKLAQPDGSELSLIGMAYAPLRSLPIGAVNTSLLYALLFNATMFLVAWIMWRKKWFVKV